MNTARSGNNLIVNSSSARRLSVTLTDIFVLNSMMPLLNGNSQSAKKFQNNGYVSDEESVRYKINKKLLKELTKKSLTKSNNTSETKVKEQTLTAKARRRSMDDGVRYKFPESKQKGIEKKSKPTKMKLKVNFWSSSSRNKLKFLDTQSASSDSDKDTIKTRQSIPPPNKSSKVTRKNSLEQIIKKNEVTPQKIVKIQTTNSDQVTPNKPIKRVTFLPSPLFSDQHAPMVTVPDDITLNFHAGGSCDYMTQSMDKAVKQTVSRKRTATGKLKSTSDQGNPNSDVSDILNISKGRPDDAEKEKCYDNELEYFSKYIVQKLRKMDTNQRIYGENLINTVIMLGQLGQLNRKTKVQNT